MRRSDADREIVLGFWVIIAAIMIFFIGQGCVSQGSPRSEVSHQIMKPRDGYKGLTNQICLQYKFAGGCEKYDVVEYDLNDAKVRSDLISFGFVCKIAGRRFKIDPDQAGFARYEAKRACWLFCKKKVEIVERVPVSNYKYLIDAGTVCYSERVYTDGLH
jgi:hypothetical protein